MILTTPQGGLFVIIKPYEEKYRDDMIFMVLGAKDALGRIPTINEDRDRVGKAAKVKEKV